MNKVELISKIEKSRAQLQAALAGISTERMPLVILHGKWSTRDLIGHLCFWEERVAALFALLQAGKTPEPFSNIDQLNALALAEFANLPLDGLLAREQSAYHAVLQIVQQASEAQMFDPGYFPWTQGTPFAEIISDNTSGHYEEHLPELTSWLKRIA